MNRIKLGFVYVLSTLIAAGCGMPLMEYTEEIKGNPSQETPSSPVGPSVPSGPGEGNGVPLITNYDLQAYVPVPTAGAAPVKAVLGRQDLEVSVVWRDADGADITGGLTAFEEGAVYQADITLKTKGDYAFDPATSFKYYPANAVAAQPGDNTDAANRSLSTVIYRPAEKPKEIPGPLTLTGLIAVPVKGATPTTSFSEGTYSGTVAWYKTVDNKPHNGLFGSGTMYTAQVTLIPPPGYVFPASVQVIHTGAETDPGNFTGEPRTGTIAFPSTESDTLISKVNLTNYVPKPAVGATPQTTFYTTEYIGKVKWTPEHSTFQAGVAYRATVTLEPAAGFVFPSDLKEATHSGAADDLVPITHEYDLSAYVPVPMRGDNPQRQGTNTWADYSTDKWTIRVYWYRHNASGSYGDDGNWNGTTETLAGDVYGAAIILKADKGYPFDEGIDFKYPTYENDSKGNNPLRAYYKFDTVQANTGTTYVKWYWQNGGDHRDPPLKYDRAPNVLYYRPSSDPDTNYPVSISKTGSGSFENGVLQYKLRTDERLIMVGFNTQDTIPTFKSPPPGGPEGGVRIATLGFKPLGIPSNIDSGGATFAQAVAMIGAAQQAGAGYLSLKLNGLTAAGKGTDGNPDNSVGAVSFSTADSPPSVVVDGGNRVVKGTDVNIPSITVGNGVTLTLRNITLKADTHSPVVRVESGGVLILEEGAVITGHTTAHSVGGGGVYVAGGGTLTMKGGEISGNTATSGNGGAVNVAAGGTFNMQGGAIKGNNVTGNHMNGGGVYVAGPDGSVPGGTFFMQGGTVSGNNAAGFAANGGGVYVATGGTFVKSTGAIYGGNGGNANTAAGSGSAVYVQGGRYRNDTVMDFLDSGKTITAGGWDYPVIPHTYYKTAGPDGTLVAGTDGTLAAGQVDWYVFTAPGGGASLSVSVNNSTVKVSAYRAYGAPISVDAALPAFAAGETIYVKVEGETASPSGTYTIRQGPLLLISDSHPVDGDKANPGNITAAGQVDWYFFTAETPGAYRVMWEDTTKQATTKYIGDVKVSAYRYDATLIFGPEDDGYSTNQHQLLSIDLAAGETIYVKAEGKSNGTYGIRYYP